MGARMTGKAGAVKIGGVKVASLTAWSLDAKLDTPDATGFEDEWKVLLAGFKGGSGSIDGMWEAGGTNIAIWTALLGAAAVTLDLYPDIAATEKFSCSAFVDFGIKTSKDAVVTFTGPFKVTGAVTRTA